MERRRFLRGLGGALLAVPVAGKLLGCVNTLEHYPPGEPPPPGGGGNGDPAPTAFTVTNSDASGHSHSFEIKCSHATEAGWVYTAQGAHSHSVTLSAQQLGAIFAGTAVTVMTADGHPHTWVIQKPASMCAEDPPPAESFSVSNSDASGHSHAFEMQCSHVDADGWVYTAQGAHTHEVRLTRADLVAVFAGQTVTITTTGGHPHTWLIRKPDGSCAGGTTGGGDSGGGGSGGGGSGGGYYGGY